MLEFYFMRQPRPLQLCVITAFRQRVKKYGSTVFNGNRFFTTHLPWRAVPGKYTKVTKGKRLQITVFPPFVYLVSFVVGLFPVRYGRAKNLCGTLVT
jgi:hypothetical protein